MSILKILIYPDPRLRTVAKPVVKFDENLKTVAKNMAETMYAEKGIGLAGTQVDFHQRIIVMDLSESKDDLKVFINPVITPIEGTIKYEEGCLSVPGYAAAIERTERVIIEAQDLLGEPFSIEADGLLSVCIQHEIDHLDGKVFVDYLSRTKQSWIRHKLKKIPSSVS